ncbi:MFS transporter [Alcaligenaceae bacterium]|nr:MFS transporter [Alcaligenaceae bacterium]
MKPGKPGLEPGGTTQQLATAVSTAKNDKARGLIVALGIGQICSWGTLYYCFPLIAEAMGLEFGWSKTSLYGAASVGLLLASLATYPVGVAIDRGYGRWVMGLSSVLAGVCLLVWSQISTLMVFYLLMACVGILQAATLYEPAFAVVSRRVGPLQARRAIISLTLWGGFSSTVFIPLTQVLLDNWGWRDALITLGLINIFICGVAYLCFIQPRRDAVSAGVANSQQIEVNRQAVRMALRQPVFWVLFVSLTVYTIIFSAFTFHMYPLLLERGLGTSDVVQAIALIGPAQVVGRTLIGVFANKISMRVIGAVVALTFPVTFGVLAFIRPEFWFIAGICATYGATNGIFTIVRGLVVPEMLSQHAYGAINGILSIPTTIARAVAPVGAAYLWSLSASYSLVLGAIVACAIILALGFWLAVWLSRQPALASPHMTPVP